MSGRVAVSGRTRLSAVVGDPIRHSLSPLLYNTAYAACGLDWVCLAFEVPAGRGAEVLGAVRTLDLGGLSVTMPLKAELAGLVDECSPTAAALGAVNSVVPRGRRLVGLNTDGQGFVDALRRATGFEADGQRCVVAGTGGAARAVVLALATAGAAEVAVVGRRPEAAAQAAALAGAVGRVGRAPDAADAALVVDATPTGMADSPAETAGPLIEAGRLGAGQVAADLVYHPRQTAWLAQAAANGAQAVGGLGMLVHQAAEQFRQWTGEEAPVAAMWVAVSDQAEAPAAGGLQPGSTRAGRHDPPTK